MIYKVVMLGGGGVGKRFVQLVQLKTIEMGKKMNNFLKIVPLQSNLFKIPLYLSMTQL